MSEMDLSGMIDATLFALRRILTYMCVVVVNSKSRCVEDRGWVEVGRGSQHPCFKLFNSTLATR